MLKEMVRTRGQQALMAVMATDIKAGTAISVPA